MRRDLGAACLNPRQRRQIRRNRRGSSLAYQLGENRTRDTCTLWNIGRSPLRTVFHVLGRSTVSLNSAQLSHLKAAIEREVDAFAGRRYALAMDIGIPTESLARMATDEDPSVRWRVGANAKTPAETLVRLASDEDPDVREEVAENANTPAEVLARLASDEDPSLSWQRAGKANTPAELLARLAADEDCDVRRRVALASRLHLPSGQRVC